MPAKPEEGFSRGADELRVGVHRSSGNVFDDVGFEPNENKKSLLRLKAKRSVKSVLNISCSSSIVERC
jgi:hypothetical protein